MGGSQSLMDTKVNLTLQSREAVSTYSQIIYFNHCLFTYFYPYYDIIWPQFTHFPPQFSDTKLSTNNNLNV